MGTIKILERTGEFEGIRISKKDLLELAVKENKSLFSESIRLVWDEKGKQKTKTIERLSIIIDGYIFYADGE